MRRRLTSALAFRPQPVIVVILLMLVSSPTVLLGQPVNGNAPVYLALGDSYPYGTSCVVSPCTPLTPTGVPQTGNGHDNLWVGYPEYLQALIDRPLLNAGCPGDVTRSFLEYTPDFPPARQQCVLFKAAGLLHVDYTGPEMAFADSYLKTHHDRVALITLQVGGPETTPVFNRCANAPDRENCVFGQLPDHIAGLVDRIGTILSHIRSSGYSGQLIFVEYPSMNYNDDVTTPAMEQIYQAIRPLVLYYQGEVAPVFQRFQVEAQPYGGNSCAAGLLNFVKDEQTGVVSCDIHPTRFGHQFIASIIAKMVAPR